MHMFKQAVFVLLSLMLLGCAGSPLSISSKSVSELKEEETADLCFALSHVEPEARDRIIQELKRRNAKGTWHKIPGSWSNESIHCDW